MRTESGDTKFKGMNRRESIIVVLSLGIDETGKRFASVRRDKKSNHVININKVNDYQWELLKLAFSSSSWILIIDSPKNKFEDAQNFDDAIMEVVPRELPTLP
jgi:hypothetical protein